jgi:hypothetical protein
MRFTSDDVVADGDGWLVRGVLNIGGLDCPLVMHVKRGGACYNGFTGTVSITKGELGVKAPGFLIRDQITLRVSTCLLP